ncbi:MAG: hypothetical protein COV10_00365 [Candidatus Vogelbacteria bacterium CG10_big_fil_rev_8_21_14_0_10_51_16]|uniref:Clan AA aspartic protease n=1 Tax=Candidatus Vogelbacteria bacterium CG10_big_fil_rev_8_21_14_0_10_51_16 TaxID=1975045 RepID=A0A2H0RFJ0_9BACT|nr:MAG: hypothetical protein COV10_00365 [Candidatus Vogelbacteria bacterium CG10_big_fil_rev_8_21_14_0_10_51_16]
MISGLFLEDTPFMQVFVAWGQAVQATYAVLDTGFSGDLQVTPQMAEELGLEVIGVTEVKIASGEVVQVPVALAMASMEREIQTIEVLIAESMPLMGISFLTKFSYKALVDCKHRTVTLEK